MRDHRAQAAGQPLFTVDAASAELPQGPDVVGGIYPLKLLNRGYQRGPVAGAQQLGGRRPPGGSSVSVCKRVNQHYVEMQLSGGQRWVSATDRPGNRLREQFRYVARG